MCDVIFHPFGWTAGLTSPTIVTSKIIQPPCLSDAKSKTSSALSYSQSSCPLYKFPFNVKRPKWLLKGSSNIEMLEPIGLTGLVKATVSIGLGLQFLNLQCLVHFSPSLLTLWRHPLNNALTIWCLSILLIMIHLVITYPVSTTLDRKSKGHTIEVVATSFAPHPKGVFRLSRNLCWGV